MVVETEQGGRVRWSVVSRHLGTPCRLVEGTSLAKVSTGIRERWQREREIGTDLPYLISPLLPLHDFSHTYPHERGNISMVQLPQRRGVSLPGVEYGTSFAARVHTPPKLTRLLWTWLRILMAQHPRPLPVDRRALFSPSPLSKESDQKEGYHRTTRSWKMSSRKESSAVINPVEMKGMGWLITGGRETVVDDNIEMAITAVAPLRESMWANSNLGYDWIPFYLLTSHRPILRPRFRTMRRRPPPLPARVWESVFWLSVARNAVQWSPDVTSLTFTDTKGFCHSPPPWISYNFLLKSPADRNNGRASWWMAYNRVSVVGVELKSTMVELRTPVELV